MQLVSKIFNLCGHDPPTSQTDRRTDIQTDDVRSQDRALHNSASRGINDSAHTMCDEESRNLVAGGLIDQYKLGRANLPL